MAGLSAVVSGCWLDPRHAAFGRALDAVRLPRAVIRACGFVVALLLLPLSYLESGVLMALSLFAFGAAVGACEVAMNIQAVIVEKGADRPLMSGFHGCFSLGGFCRRRRRGRCCFPWGVSPFAATLTIVVALVVVCSPAAATRPWQ